MPNKKTESITTKQIEQDIINSLNYPKNMTKAEYENPTRYIVGAVLTILFVASLMYFLPRLDGLSALLVILGIMLAMVLIIVIVVVSAILLRKHEQNNVRMDNYEVSTEVMSHVEIETYEQRESSRRSIVRRYITITNCTLHFENGKSWRIPKKIYTWSEYLQMSDESLCASSDCGDTFIVVTEKRSGNIAMAYPTKLFRYISK